MVCGGTLVLHAGTTAAAAARTRSVRMDRPYRALEPGVNSRLDRSGERGQPAARVHPQDRAVSHRGGGEGGVRTVEAAQESQVARVEDLEPAALVVGRARLDDEKIADRR